MKPDFLVLIYIKDKYFLAYWVVRDRAHTKKKQEKKLYQVAQRYIPAQLQFYLKLYQGF